MIAKHNILYFERKVQGGIYCIFSLDSVYLDEATGVVLIKKTPTGVVKLRLRM